MIQLRPFAFDDADYEFLARMQNVIMPDQKTVPDFWRRADRDYINPDHLFQRLIVLYEDEPVGFAEYGHNSWSYRPDKYRLFVAILPEARRQGAGGHAFDHIVAQVMAREPKLLEVDTREDQAAGVAFLEKRGFTLAARAPISLLDPAEFDLTRFASYLTRSDEIEFVALRQLMREDPDHRRKLYDLEVTLCYDLPWYDDHFTPMPYERWEKASFANPDLRPEGYIVARDGDTYVGLSALWGNQASDERVYTGLTGVLREYRRRGIGLGMKVKAVLWARSQRGANGRPPLIQTENEENNPMFDINVRLGFVEQPAWVTYTRVLDDSWRDEPDE